MSLQDQLNADAVNVFLPDFGETLIYYKVINRTSTPVQVQGIVNRDPLSLFSEIPDGATYVFEVLIPNNSIVGITSVNQGNDQIVLTPLGGSAKKYTVSKILDSDSSMWYLGVS